MGSSRGSLARSSFAEILARTPADAQCLRDAVQDAGGQVYSWNFAQQALTASTLALQR